MRAARRRSGDAPGWLKDRSARLCRKQMTPVGAQYGVSDRRHRHFRACRQQSRQAAGAGVRQHRNRTANPQHALPAACRRGARRDSSRKPSGAGEGAMWPTAGQRFLVEDGGASSTSRFRMKRPHAVHLATLHAVVGARQTFKAFCLHSGRADRAQPDQGPACRRGRTRRISPAPTCCPDASTATPH